MKVCCICGKKYEGYGNNAQPVKDGRCCDECNGKYVVPKRIELLYRYEKRLEEMKQNG